MSNSTASKTSDENVELTKTLSSSAWRLSSPQLLSWLLKLPSVVGLMTMMRGTVWGEQETLSEALPRFRESNESLLRLANLLWVLPLSLAASEMSLVRLWLRLLVRTSRGRVAMVRDLDTSSCSQVLNDSFVVDGCWWCEKKREKNKKKQQTHKLMRMWMHATIIMLFKPLYIHKMKTTHYFKIIQMYYFFFTFSAVLVVIGSCPNRLLCDLLLYECLEDDILLT